MSSEEIYDVLYENAEKIDIGSLIDKLLDEHMDGEDGNGGGEGEDGDKDGKGRPRLSAEERQKIRDEIKEAVLAAAAASDGGGNLPAGVKRIIQDMTAPKMNWREFLRMQLESTIKSDFTWMRASRRGWHMDAVMPGMKNDELIDIAVSIDASGSMGADMLKDILSETQGIMDSFPAYKLHLISFDTAVYNPATYDSENLDNLVDYEIHGGGGTDFDCVFEYFKENDIQPKRHIMFTDGYPFGSWGDENYCDTVFIIHGNTNIVPPWGQHAYYEEEK
jgi:predicted metal-dependent peptidase